MSQSTPPYRLRWKNQAGRRGRFSRWSQPDRLHDAADRARVDQLDRTGHGSDLEPFGVVDRPDAPGVGDRSPQLGKLPGGGASGLVAHHILAVAHRLDGDCGPVAIDRSGKDQLHRGIFQQAAFVGDARYLRIAPDEAIQRLWFAVGPVADALAAVFE
jgi:hypothetical protein